MLQKINLFTGIIVLVLSSTISPVQAQQFPDFIRVPVTFYDFHSDRSNPEFEQRHSSGVRTRMVQSTLGSDGKPEIGSSPYLNYGLKKWFTRWTPGDYRIPSYTPNAPAPPFRYADGEWVKEFQEQITYVGPVMVNYDTAFKNIVIQDSLIFVHVGNGTYEYKNENFFPLDDRGFGNEWNHELGNTNFNAQQGINPNHNYSFTMELHWNFVKKPGLQFNFSGDDDVWVFVNKALMMDLGGIHDGKTPQSFQVDNSLADGKAYDLDIFYAERHASGSHIRISTNIIFAPSTIGLYAQRGTPNTAANKSLGLTDSVKAGQSFTIYGNVFDSAGTWKPENNQYITWEISDTKGNPGLTATKGDSTTFTATVANTQVTITARYKNPNDPSGRESIKQITLTIKEGPLPPPYPIKFYDKEGDPSSLTPVTSMLTVAGKNITVYAHLFDSAGVWLSNYDRFIKWSVKEAGTGTVLNPLVNTSTTITAIRAGIVTIIAEFTDPDNRARPKSYSELPVRVSADVEFKLDIITDSTSKKVGDQELIISQNEDYIPLFGVVRDKYNNFIRYAGSSARWVSTHSELIDVSQTSGSTTTLVKRNLSTGESSSIILSEGNLVPDTLVIGFRGSRSVISTPVPFLQNITNIKAVLGQKANYYTNVLNSNPSTNVLLIAVSTEGSLIPVNPSDSARNPYTSYGKVRIYDAVGNLIRTDLPLVRANVTNSRSYGVLWDGLNSRERFVGAGAYLVDIRAKEKNKDGSIGDFSIRTKVAIGVRP